MLLKKMNNKRFNLDTYLREKPASRINFKKTRPNVTILRYEISVYGFDPSCIMQTKIEILIDEV